MRSSFFLSALILATVHSCSSSVNCAKTCCSSVGARRRTRLIAELSLVFLFSVVGISIRVVAIVTVDVGVHNRVVVRRFANHLRDEIDSRYSHADNQEQQQSEYAQHPRPYFSFRLGGRGAGRRVRPRRLVCRKTLDRLGHPTSRHPGDGETCVTSSAGDSTSTSGVPSSMQKLRFRSVNVLLQVGQRFTIAFFHLARSS